MKKPKISRLAKPESQFIAGTDRLFARRKPGEIFTLEEIGRECGMTKQNIHAIYKRALYKFAHNMHKMCPDYFEAQAGSSGLAGIFSYLRSSQNLARKITPRVKPSSRIKSSMTLEDVQRQVRDTRPAQPTPRGSDKNRERMIRQAQEHERFMASAYPL